MAKQAKRYLLKEDAYEGTVAGRTVRVERGESSDFVTSDPAKQQLLEMLGVTGSDVEGSNPSPDYAEHTVEELQGLLRARDLPVSGTKDELVERLTDSDKEE